MNKSLKALFLANGVFVFAGNLLGPLYAVFVEGLDKGVMSISASWAAFLVSATLFTYVSSLFGDKVKHKEYLLMSGYLIRAAVWGLFITIHTIGALVALQIILGLGEALGTPAFDVIFAEHLDRGHHIADFSRWKIINNLVSAAGTLLGGFIASNYGFSPLFAIMSAGAFISFIFVLTKPRSLL